MVRARFVFLALFLLASAACHTYVPVANPQPGTTVRVRVPVTSALDNGNAAPSTASIEGTVIASGDTLLLGTTQRQEYGAYREVTRSDTLRLTRDQVLSLEEAEFSVGRTAVLTVAIVGAAVGLAFASWGGGGDDGPIDGGPPPPQGAIVISNSFLSGVLGVLGIAR
jgi:hypothetical protein